MYQVYIDRSKLVSEIAVLTNYIFFPPQHANVHPSGSRFDQTRIDTPAQPPEHLPHKVARDQEREHQAAPPAIVYDDHQRPLTPVHSQHRQHLEQQHHEQQQQIRMQMIQDEQTRTFRSQHSPQHPQSRAVVPPLNEIQVDDAGHPANIRFTPGPRFSADHGLPQDTDVYRHPVRKHTLEILRLVSWCPNLLFYLEI